MVRKTNLEEVEIIICDVCQNKQGWVLYECGVCERDICPLCYEVIYFTAWYSLPVCRICTSVQSSFIDSMKESITRSEQVRLEWKAKSLRG